MNAACRLTLARALAVLCALGGALLFASAPAQAKLVHAFSSSFTGSGAQALSEPEGMAVNEETGGVYVVDRGHSRVEEFNSTGTVVLAEFDGSAAPDGALGTPSPDLAVSRLASRGLAC